VRLALGARRGGIVGLVVKEALIVTVAGLAAGLAVALAATRLIETMLAGLTPRDPLTFAGAAAMLLIVAGLAAAAPAWRASRTDPLKALRAE
jgi:ABC-type antimicrobial peptide transport system permease subunit